MHNPGLGLGVEEGYCKRSEAEDYRILGKCVHRYILYSR